MFNFWQSITVPQATIISGVLTLISAIAAIVLGWWLFSGRVKDLKGAIEESDKLLRDHQSQVNFILEDVRAKLSAINIQGSVAAESLGQLRGEISDIEVADQALMSTQDLAPRETLRDYWTAVRDELEHLAADSRVDGRTRAKYARIDRRKYLELVDSLARDGYLGRLAPQFRTAVSIWQQYRNNKRPPSAEDLDRMREIHSKIFGKIQ